jgi:hypothetical protein
VQRLLFGVLHPLDVHVFTSEEFEDMAHEELSFTWNIARQARLYHWSEEARRRVPSLLPRATGSHAQPMDAVGPHLANTKPLREQEYNGDETANAVCDSYVSPRGDLT